jgi:branched-chain amino acid transport system permease protein
MLLVDQMVDFTLSIADCGYVLKKLHVRIVHAGSAVELYNNPVLEQAYLGEGGSTRKGG